MNISTEELKERISHLQERLKDMRQHKYPADCPNAAAYLESLKAEKQQDIYLLTELLAVREVQSLRGIRVGNLPTMNQDEYPGLPDWWVQLRIGTDGDEVLARIYGSTPHEAMMRARAIAAQPAPSMMDERAAFSAWNNEDNLPIAGVPAKKVKDISPELITGEIERIADNYITYAGWYKQFALSGIFKKANENHDYIEASVKVILKLRLYKNKKARQPSTGKTFLSANNRKQFITYYTS